MIHGAYLGRAHGLAEVRGKVSGTSQGLFSETVSYKSQIRASGCGDVRTIGQQCGHEHRGVGWSKLRRVPVSV